ncbi:hypothetical protein ABIF07_003596 [Bradyrhizobium elkanii]|nr:hypothetical protein [Bradyrhizobium elkanii]MCS3689378.1 hypothetical protein [Bradyrhizobium elkanii]
MGDIANLRNPQSSSRRLQAFAFEHVDFDAGNARNEALRDFVAATE